MVDAKALKLSHYKDVFRVTAPDGSHHIVKTFKGWAKIHCHNNAKYTLQAIQLLSAELSGVRLPSWVALDDDDVSVRMELLPELRKGKEVYPPQYKAYHHFFTELYQINAPDWVKDIRQSKVIAEEVLAAIPSDQPMALGFKGDAWGNVLLSRDTLVLADVEDICIEPLGFSEVIALLEMTTAATSGKPQALFGLFSLRSVQPAFIHFLTTSQAQSVIQLARLAWESRIVSCGKFRKACKVRIADQVVHRLEQLLAAQAMREQNL